MDRFPFPQTLVFILLGGAGVVLSVSAAAIVGAADAASVRAIGAAMFGGSLAFFLSEMFAWERSRRHA